MTISKIKKATSIISFLMVFFFGFALNVNAQTFDKDLAINVGDVRFPSDILSGESVRVYVTVHNTSNFDLSGVVKFYDERVSDFMGPDQPVSILAGRTDDVFVDWKAESLGNHPLAIRIVPWDTEGDDPSNNKITKTLYVDTDKDGDGIGDRNDPDDDNDGIPDRVDAFPANPFENIDTDGDGLGDNVDEDDDNDGVSDIQDQFPLDASESKDSDGDGTGDNGDPFPFDSTESRDSDGDGVGDNKDLDDDNHGPKPFILLDDTEVQVGKPLTFNALRSTDPDGKIVKYDWQFDDGSTGNGVMIEHAFADRGDYVVTLTVTDDRGETREQQVHITVTHNRVLIALIFTSVLLLLMLIGLFMPGSRFHYRNMGFMKKGLK